MTDLVMGWARALWGREMLRQRVDRAERRYAKMRILLESFRQTTQSQADAIAKLEAENQKWAAFAEQYEAESKVIDPNAKCPGCGHRSGFLDHVWNGTELRVRNNCLVCKVPFISSPPVAGPEVAAAAYQADVPGMKPITGSAK